MVDKNLKLPAVKKCFAIPEVLSKGDCKTKCNYCNEWFVDLVVRNYHL